MCLQCLEGAILSHGSESDIKELALAPYVSKGGAQTALKVVPGDVNFLVVGSHDAGHEYNGTFNAV